MQASGFRIYFLETGDFFSKILSEFRKKIVALQHQYLNWSWYKNLAKGKYTILRILQTAVDLLMLLCMLGLMVSGIMMSRSVFSFLGIRSGMGFARILHMLAAYWGFILMSVHLGMHWGMILGMIRKMAKQSALSKPRAWTLRALALLLCGFGVNAFLKNDLGSYLFMKSQFVFFDLEQPLILFFAEYIAIMGLWVCAAYYSLKAVRLWQTKKK